MFSVNLVIDFDTFHVQWCVTITLEIERYVKFVWFNILYQCAPMSGLTNKAW